MILDIFSLAFKSLGSNRLRTSLSILGIIIWVFTIVLVVSIGNSVQFAIQQQLRFLSVTTIVAAPVNSAISSSKLWEGDIDYVLDKSKYIPIGTPIVFWQSSFVANDEKKQFSVFWANHLLSQVLNLKIKSWRFFNEQEFRNTEKVVVLGKNIITDIYKWNEDILGSFITIWKNKFKVIGILEPSWSIWSFSFDDSWFIPSSTAKRFVSNSEETPLIFLADKLENVQNAMAELKWLLREKHRLKEEDSDDFMLRDQWSILVLANAATSWATFLLISISVIVLIVSGIWIMNVMFAVVAERRKEIWIMKAVWARKSYIMQQFLIESILLTLVWAIVGMWLAEWLIYMINMFSPFQMIRTLAWDLLGLGFAIFTWVFSWVYPSYHASKMDPVDALSL